jgi:hypothetical protein
MSPRRLQSGVSDGGGWESQRTGEDSDEAPTSGRADPSRVRVAAIRVKGPGASRGDSEGMPLSDSETAAVLVAASGAPGAPEDT